MRKKKVWRISLNNRKCFNKTEVNGSDQFPHKVRIEWKEKINWFHNFVNFILQKKRRKNDADIKFCPWKSKQLPRMINLIKEEEKKLQSNKKKYFRISNFHQLTGLQLITINQRFVSAKNIFVLPKFRLLQSRIT